MELVISQDAAEGKHTLTAEGELDMATASRLEAAVTASLERGPAELIVDLRAVSFMDSTGLRAILRARQACEDSHCLFFLIPAEQSEQRRLFHVSGLIGKLTFREPQADGSDPQRDGDTAPA